MAKRRQGQRRKKLVPVEVDRTTRWGTTRAKQAGADLGRAIRNVLAEMGIEPTRLATSFHTGNEIVARVEQHAKTLVHHDERMKRLAENTQTITEAQDREIDKLRADLVTAVKVLDKLAATAWPEPDPKGVGVRATGTTTNRHSMRIGAVHLDDGVLWAQQLGCSCGIRFTSEDEMVNHLAMARAQRS